MTEPVRVRPLTRTDVAVAAALHARVLDMEFLVRYGPAFMRAYYRAWIEAPDAISLAAVDEQGELVGTLLGATDTTSHMNAMVRRSGWRLASRLALYAAGHPALAKDLIITRGRRYLRGVARLVTSRRHGAATGGSTVDRGPRVGEITHVLVRPERQGLGAGRVLVLAALEQGREAQLDEMVLVTPPDQDARGFYERLGWIADGDVTSRSGEDFVRYRYLLRRGDPPGGGGPPGLR